MSNQENTNSGQSTAAPQLSVTEVEVPLTLNGERTVWRVASCETLLDTLRERIRLTGTKKGCDHGQCGACTVLIDGARVNACLVLSVSLQDAEVVTVEGLSSDGELHPVQAAFLDCDAFQCGYCTPGQIVSMVGMLGEPWGEDDAALKESMSGNICRCGAYRTILQASKKARQLQEGTNAEHS